MMTEEGRRREEGADGGTEERRDGGADASPPLVSLAYRTARSRIRHRHRLNQDRAEQERQELRERGRGNDCHCRGSNFMTHDTRHESHDPCMHAVRDATQASERLASQCCDWQCSGNWQLKVPNIFTFPSIVEKMRSRRHLAAKSTILSYRNDRSINPQHRSSINDSYFCTSFAYMVT